ncbi:sugar-binding domain-containing protein [Paenibacillus qinlingensis]|uniref:Beta-galactosidase/beta-glucuronidase n=1 Tax=Paenibacillus qinlingensis TaxID=1837343 RepID=A0ABU1P124_9BACL|nr:sugar-binding domain-containing protein [Paenibacillus qinlingensis]MDR6553244.1 beta-galactosidase/beta-glucuronidase [Paenibacillus qinlingensis]
MSNQPRAEYPRPQFVRDSWINLNGEWEFEFDDESIGSKQKWHQGEKAFSQKIQVPFAFQSQLSGIGNNEFHDVVWYRRELEIPKEFANKRILLHFGAVDYLASVWVNGILVATHEGGHTPFHADITDALLDGSNKLVVKAVDFSKDVTLPRGKQYWKADSASIFYTRTTGIWQTVWMEAVSADAHLAKVKMTPDIDAKQIEISYDIEGIDAHATSTYQLKVDISFKGEIVSKDVYGIRSGTGARKVRLNDFNDHGLGGWWTPEKPNLYDVNFTLLIDNEVVDVVSSYFGMRKVSIEDGKLCLNNRPYFLKMVLDQGYFPDGNLTPPSDDAIKQDVELTKAMGFNGARKHQKLEDPRFLYWCDVLGLVVWSEAANAYEYTDKYVGQFTKEWIASMERDYNHPSIIAWVPLNESWGVPNIQIDKLQQQHALTMYHLSKSLDPMRPVISNDGWELVTTDIFAIHDYEWREEVLSERYSSKEKAVHAMPANRRLFVEGFPYQGQPILVTEFGGIAYKKSEWEGWGYSGADNDEDYEQKLRAVIRPLLNSGVVQGYCYTQLTDVEQEINGLLTYDRKPKIPVEIIKAINDRN